MVKPINIIALAMGPTPSHRFEVQPKVSKVAEAEVQINNPKGEKKWKGLAREKGETDPLKVDLGEKQLAREIAKALAFGWSIQTAQRLLLHHTVFETDCQDVVTEWKKSTGSQCTYLALIIQECKSLVGNRKETQLAYAKWAGNVVAHCLARLAFSTLESYWLEEVPSQAANAVNHDKGVFVSPPV
ncbi:hypothetical protein E2542_SST12231 [Spatholobus suberectus]|nr:hypothetical protein E2542_SST12231 [Spatholobus suberectus]